MNNMRMVIAILSLAVNILFVSAATWTYENNGAAQWANDFPQCGGQNQSPINFAESSTVVDNNLSPFTFTGYDSALGMILQNNGHTAQVDVYDDAFIEGGNLPERYKLAQFHFHWGSDNTKGSEHTADGQARPMEVHLVHYKESLGSLANAADKPEGLAVIGLFFQVDSLSNNNYNEIVSRLADVTTAGSQYPLLPQVLNDLFPSINGNFFRYSGSLTTPPCFESVIWTVIQEPISISSSQLASFRQLHTAALQPIVNNYRPPQPLNGRTVKSTNFGQCLLATPWLCIQLRLSGGVSFLI